MLNSRSFATAICLAGMVIVNSILSPALAQEGAQVHLIFGSGFKPSNLTEGGFAAGGTLIVADKETIVVLRSNWKVTGGSCEDWVILRGRQHRIPSSSLTTCPERGGGDEVALAMGGKSMIGRITVTVPQSSNPNADYGSPKILRWLYGDLLTLAEKEEQRQWQEEAAQQQQVEEAAQKRRVEEAAQKRRAEEAAQKRRAEEAAQKRRAEEAAQKRRAKEKAQQRSTEFKCALSGRVVDQDTGEPLAGVRMDLFQSIQSQRPQKLKHNVTTTGAAGDFRIDCSSITESSYPLTFGLHRKDWKATHITGPDVKRKGTRNGLLLKVRTGPAPLLRGELVRFSFSSKKKGDTWFATGKVSNVSGRHLDCIRLRFKMSTSFQDKQQGVPNQDLGILEVEVRNLGEGEERPYWKAMPGRVGFGRASPATILCK